MDYYKSPNRFTRISEHEWIPAQLKLDSDTLFSIVKSILIHPIDAKTAKVRYDRKNKGIFHCQNSTVDEMLRYSKLAPFLKMMKLPLSTLPNDRAVLSCDHHALLFASFVRHLGVPARVRTGYSQYIVSDLAVPHWVVEVLHQEKGKWIIMDPERQIKNVDRSEFLFSPEVWKLHIEQGRSFSSYSGFSGRQGLKYALLCDLNCLFKNELLSYEWRLKAHNRNKPDIARTSFERLSKENQEKIHTMADLMMNPDQNLPELWDLYRTIVEEQDLKTSGFRSCSSP